MPPIHHFKNWTIDRAGAGVRVTGERYNEFGEKLFQKDKITNLHRIGKSESGQLAGFNREGLVKVYLDL